MLKATVKLHKNNDISKMPLRLPTYLMNESTTYKTEKGNAS